MRDLYVTSGLMINRDTAVITKLDDKRHKKGQRRGAASRKVTNRVKAMLKRTGL